MIKTLCAVSVLGFASLAGVAYAAGGAQSPQAARAAERVVYVCETDDLTREAWRREHGTDMRFVTAEEARDRAAGAWDGPRCMTEGEARKLERSGRTEGVTRAASRR